MTYSYLSELIENYEKLKAQGDEIEDKYIIGESSRQEFVIAICRNTVKRKHAIAKIEKAISAQKKNIEIVARDAIHDREIQKDVFSYVKRLQV